MTAVCKFCGAQNLSWIMPKPDCWMLIEDGTGLKHRCMEWVEQHKPLRSERAGVFLRLYGPRTARTHAVLIQGGQTPPNTPRAMYEELESEPRMPTYYHLAQRKKP